MGFERFKGSFLSYGGVRYDVRLERVGAGEDCAVGELVFDGADPLVIELKESAKHDPVQGCSATLKVVSESDRAYVHLYTEDVAGWMLSVYLDGKPWWRGLLDAEQYEEPFERLDGYTVQLTFSDMGAMDRLRFDLAGGGWASLGEVVAGALEACGYGGDFVESDGLVVDGAERGALWGLKVRTDNFYDEEGEAMTWREAVESVLQPLGLRLVQRAGVFTVYDLAQVVRQEAGREQVEWMGDSSTLGVDRVYSEVRITFNPYGDTTVAEADLEGLEIPIAGGTLEVKAPGFEKGDGVDEVYEGFKVQWTDGEMAVGASGIALGEKGSFYRMESVYSGSDSKGVAELIRTTTDGSDRKIKCGEAVDLTNLRSLNGAELSLGDVVKPLAGLEPVWIGDVGDRLLKISVMLLHDCRYNPFEEKNQKNEQGNYERQLEHWNFVSVPMRLWIKTDDGRYFHYSNSRVVESGSYCRPPRSGDAVLGGSQSTASREVRPGWIEGDSEPAWGDAWLMWYDWGDRKGKTGCDGWATNRQAIGRYTGDLPAWWQKRGDGEFVAVPAGVSGMLHLEIGTGVRAVNHKNEGSAKHATVPYWTLFKDLKVELVDQNGLGIEGNDIVYSCTINERAKESLEFETTSGTGKDALPTGRGLLYFVADGHRVEEIGRYRRGREQPQVARPEEHLMEIIASQYGQRADVLSGVARIASGAVVSLKDASVPGKVFMLGAEVQHLQQDVADCTLVEVRN